MPKGPKGEKRPADVIGNAVKVMKIAVGEEAELTVFERDAPASQLASKGGKARSEALSPERRKEIAKKASLSRWKKG